MANITDIWQLTPETAHPRAREMLVQPFYWDFGDPDSPLGSDVGADTLAAYLRFHTVIPHQPIAGFVKDQLASYNVASPQWDLMDESHLRQAIDAGHGYGLVTSDDVMLGLAFAQIVLDGRIDVEVKRQALLALAREGTHAMLLFRGGDGIEARRAQLS